ncbi:molybdate ABC transporter substrate-binding protein [Streptomyces sp. NRRL B-24484]|uniref:molybdate ABC transporter substrate-binding protein n=1 Tax=Streptomyces sp. NRRL B-24484 TaxID=1463833 RepID=UPI0004C26636|nr:molybdate ABC transporter substrate-binding protein [Streptomyces sp. NRRL B-24484]
MSTARRRSAVAALAAIALAAGLTACGSSGTASSNAAPASSTASAGAPSSAAKVSGNLTVFAAASLKETFTALGKKFEAANPGVKVTFNFGGSSALAQSIVSGAPADVFAAASPATMKTVSDAKAAEGTPQVFVRNTLEIAVPKGNPKHIAALKDLSGVKVALCAKEVPCGAAALKALQAGGVTITPVTLEQDVKGALTKVELGEVDASLVYRTDVQADAAKIEGVEFPEAAKAVNDYPIAALAKAPNAPAAAAFVAYIRSAEASQALTAAGFQAP